MNFSRFITKCTSGMKRTNSLAITRMMVQPDQWKRVRKSQAVDDDSPDGRRQCRKQRLRAQGDSQGRASIVLGCETHRPGRDCPPQRVQKEIHVRRQGTELLSEG